MHAGVGLIPIREIDPTGQFPYWQPVPDMRLHHSGRMDCIIEQFLYVGDLESATDATLLPADTWRCISLLPRAEFKYAPIHFRPMDHLRLEMEDTETQSLESITQVTTPFLSQARYDGKRVLVHCSAGISRSVAVVLAYLLSSFDMTLEEAYMYVQKRRPVASPNIGFMRQLAQIK